MTAILIPSPLRIGDAMSQKELDLALASHAHDGLFLEVADFLRAGANPKYQNSLALRLAAGGGHVECLRLLIPLSDATACDRHALVWAATHGYADCVRLLIPASDLARNQSAALGAAATAGHADCVALLLPASAPLMDQPQPFNDAIENGRANVLSLMLAWEPALVGKIDLEQLRSRAEERGHQALAALALSIAERVELDRCGPAACLPCSASKPRL